MQRCRLLVDPRGTAVTVTGRSQRTRIRSGILDFPSVNLIQIRGKEPAPLFENNTDIYIDVTKATVTARNTHFSSLVLHPVQLYVK